MRLFDLHCDTLTECFKKNLSIYNNDVTDITVKGKSDYIQAFALYTKQSMPIEFLREYFIRNFEYLEKQVRGIENFSIIEDNLPNKTAGGIFAIRTVENCNVLYDLNNFDLFLKYNIFAASLTHNEQNCLAGGALSEGNVTDLGYKVISLFNSHNIALDISHLNDISCFEALSYSDKPIVATHSNSKVVTDNKRNISDEIFREVALRGGVVGINMHSPFLSNKEATVDDIVKHIYHFLSLDGENVVALGCDMDGGLIPSDIINLSGLEKLYDYMLKLNFSENIVDKIFYKNAYDFFVKRGTLDDI